ncbi:MAG: hypothetical protein WCJ29_02745 [bacterium]
MKLNILARVAVGSMFLASCLVLTGCSGNGPDTTATVILHNNSKQSFNLWVGHGEPGPQNMTEVGGQNGSSVTLKTRKESEEAIPDWNDSIKVNAKRPGGEIKTTQEIYPRGPTTNTTIIINWDGKNFSQQ